MKLNLQDPEMSYRPAPFWSWNENLSSDELRRQIRLMHEAGLGGFFMHARGGLQTVYLSEEWMTCVKACLEEAAKYKMNAWLYDENGWPSGFGGGLVNGLGPKYQQKYLRHEIINAANAAERENSIAFYSQDGTTLLGRTLPSGTTGPILRCFFEVNRYYVDNLDAEVVAEFLRVTHQHYYEILPAGLLKALRGIFTDEPQLSRNGLLWSEVLETEYRQAYDGRELLEELPWLFLGSAQSDAVRIRFWSLCARLFNEHFMKQIREWCDAHHWEITGHHVLEESCQSQISSNGSVMAQYRYYNVPGVDHLCRTQASPVAAVQAVSSAAQFGQKQILTESFALTGWACNFTGMRWIYQQQMAHGINYLCPHLQGVSLRGLRKRDYPASFFYHQPWWEDYPVLNGYFSRVGMLLAEGKSTADVLVVHPLSSAWKLYFGDDHYGPIDHYTQTLRRTTEALDARLIAHHYADELIVADCGSVKNGLFKIGKATYKRVIVPQVSNLSGKLYELLVKFEKEGGVILKVRNQFDNRLTIDGVPADREARQWFDGLCAFDSEEAAAQAAAELQEDRVLLTEHGIPATGVVGTYRDFEDLDGRKGRFHYLANTRYTQKTNLTIALPRTGRQVEVIDPETGRFAVLSGVRRRGDYLVFDYTLAAAGAVMFFVADHPAKHAPRCKAVDPFAGETVKMLSPVFQLEESTPNILTLDRCRYRVDGGDWERNDVISLQARLLKLKRDCDVEWEFEFEVAGDFNRDQQLILAVETPEKFHFSFNDHIFEAVDEGYLFDKAFRKIALPGAIRQGTNVIRLATRYHESAATYASIEAAKVFESEYNKLTFDSEFESVYLCGDFSVRHKGRVEPLLRKAVRYCGEFELGASLQKTGVAVSDLLGAGMPFFSGKARFQQEFKLTAHEVKEIRFLRMKLNGANSVKVRLNDEEVAARYWEPFAVDVATYLQEGKNTLELEIATSLRNTLGPHHLEEGESYAVHTMSFNREPNVIGREPAPYNEGYCFVELGIVEPELSR